MASKKKTVKHSDNLVLNIKDLIDFVKSKKTADPFKEPVDPVKDAAPGYFEIIKHPMDISTIIKKLRGQQYTRPNEVLEDFMLICKNCEEYNTNPEFKIRKTCESFKAMVRKKWEENAEALASYGIDINNETFDYSKVNFSIFDEVKMSKEQKALLQGNPTLTKKTSTQPDYTSSYNHLHQQTPSTTLHQIPSHLSRQSSQHSTTRSHPTMGDTSRVNSQTMSYNTAPLQASNLVQSSYGDQTNPQPAKKVHSGPAISTNMPYGQPTTNQNMYQPTYQPTYQPQYRPSYPKTSQAPQPTQTASESLKIDLSSLLGVKQSTTSDFDASGTIDLNFGGFSNTNYGQQNHQPQGFYNQTNMTGYDNGLTAPPASDFDSSLNFKSGLDLGLNQIQDFSRPSANNQSEDRLFDVLAQELNTSSTKENDTRMDIYPDNNSWGKMDSLYGQNATVDYGTGTSQKDYGTDLGIGGMQQPNGPQNRNETSYFFDTLNLGPTMPITQSTGTKKIGLDNMGMGIKQESFPTKSSNITTPAIRTDNMLKSSQDTNFNVKSEVKTEPSTPKELSRTSSKKGPDHISTKAEPVKAGEPSKDKYSTGSSYPGKEFSTQIKLENPMTVKSEVPDKPKEKKSEIKKEPSDEKAKAKPPSQKDIWENSKPKEEKSGTGDSGVKKEPAFPTPKINKQPFDRKPGQEENKREGLPFEKSEASQKKMEFGTMRSLETVQDPTLVRVPSNKSMKSEEIIKIGSNQGDGSSGIKQSSNQQPKPEKKIEKPANPDKPKSDKGPSAPSNSSQVTVKKEGEKMLISIPKGPSEKSTFQTPTSKSNKMETENEKPSMKVKSGSSASEKEATSTAGMAKRPVENEDKKSKNFEPEQAIDDLIADIMQAEQGSKIHTLDEARSHTTKQQSDTEAESRGEDYFEKSQDNKEIKPPKSGSIKKDKDKDRKIQTTSGERERERSDEGKKKVGSSKSKMREEQGEMYYHELLPAEEVTNTSNKLKLDLPAIRKEYEAYARRKVPKYLKKFQKHIRRFGDIFKELDVKDEALLKLKSEVEHLNLGEKSYNYSRVLLYLFNILVFFKYQHEINRQKVTKKVMKRLLNIIKKAFSYLKEVLKLQYMKFSEEEMLVFDKSAKEFRVANHEKAKLFREGKSGSQVTSSQNKQLSRSEIHSIETGAIAGDMPKKITIIQASADEEPKVVTKPVVPKKDAAATKQKILPPQTKKVPKVETAPKEETEEDRIKVEMSKFLAEIRGSYDAKPYVENLEKLIDKSWRELQHDHLEEAKENERKVDQMQDARDNFANQDDTHMEVENDIFPTTSSSMSFSIMSQDKKARGLSGSSRKLPFNRPSVFSMEDDRGKYQDLPLWGRNESLLQGDRRLDLFQINYIPDMKFIEGSLKLPNIRISKQALQEKKVSFSFFNNKIDDSIKFFLGKKGYAFTANNYHTQDKFLTKLVLIQVDMKQPINMQVDPVEIKIRNHMSIEAFDKMQNIHEERIKNEIKLKDYDVLLPIAHIKELMQNNDIIDKMLANLSKGNWKFYEKLAVIYGFEQKYDKKAMSEQKNEYFMLNINLLVLIEDFSKFKLEINEASII